MKPKLTPDLREFVGSRTDVEAVVQRCGVDTYDLLLIAPDGEWTRGVFTSAEAARGAAEDLGVFLHEGWDDETLTRRLARYDPWGTAGGRRRAL